ncbi:CHRD domain-containing protein [Azoarcus sp. DN11]|uniref:CHRD domain-containing protein n=1 Tax=Azoarcus sp. DN11 TaxID=356837 RepID=UPI0013E2AB92|nr:CHRD domain-containing protein [Azoarcus sp. DN11]
MRKTLTALALALGFASAVHAQDPMQFQAHLVGGDLFGNVIATPATGEAKFEVIQHATGQAVKFKLEVEGLRNLFMAHIHVAPVGPVANNQPVGPIAFWFVPTVPGVPDSNIAAVLDDRLSDGFVMTNAQMVGPLAFDPANRMTTGIAGLIKAIHEGRATIVVHTSDLDNTNNKTPGVAGDSPAGELRGLIQ